MDQTAIIGHQNICRFLGNALAKQKESHAYLFLGQPLVGKGTVARWFADKILGEAKAERNFNWLEPEKGIKIADIRKLRSDLSLTNPFGRFRVVVLRRAEVMTPEAQNAFLKVLEEPKTAVVFILTAETLRGLLATVVSRVQIVRFAPVPTEVIATALQQSGETSAIAQRAARLSAGCPGKARQLCEGEHLAQAETRRREILSLFSRWPHERFQLAYRLLEEKRLGSFLEEAEGLLRDVWQWQQGNKQAVTNLGLTSEISLLAQQIDASQIRLGLQEIRRWRYQQEHNVNKKLALERFMLLAFSNNFSKNKLKTNV